MNRFLLLFALAVVLAGCGTVSPARQTAGPWNLEQLRSAPAAQFGPETNGVREVYYEGAAYQGKPTRVFAWYARPSSGKGPFPAMLLVHGGGGKAFREWAVHWASRGYVALAMDLRGNGPSGRLPDGGPEQKDEEIFRDFTPADADQLWPYHAVAAVLRGHTLLETAPEVDRSRVGITGISWGGYLTCIVAGIDHRLKVAVPVYGCGFLHENSVWLPRFEKMNPVQRQRWVEYFDPSSYLAGVRCPILFLNGSNDFAYPLDSYQKSYGKVAGPMTLSVRVRLPHGHIWSFGEVDRFVDSVLLGGDPLPGIEPMRLRDGVVSSRVDARVPLQKAEFNFTSDDGPWQKRLWKTVPARIEGNRISAPLPGERIRVGYLSVTDQRDVTVSAPHLEFGVP